MNRHSAPNVGNAPVSGPESGSRRTSASCQKATFSALLDDMDSGTAVSYSPFSGRIQMERRLAAILAADVVGYSHGFVNIFDALNVLLG